MLGIIVAAMNGCGKGELIEEFGRKNKIADLQHGLANNQEYVDEVMRLVEKYDIVFIDADMATLMLFIDNGIFFDLFYPSHNRKNEFIEDAVKHRVSFAEISKLDKNFSDLIDAYDEIDSEFCMKHKLSNHGSYLIGEKILTSYLTDAQEARKNEAHESEKVLETQEG